MLNHRWKIWVYIRRLHSIEIVGKEYILTARVFEAVKSQVEYTRDKVVQYIKAKDMIMEYLSINNSITNAIIKVSCGFTKQQARTTIEKMIKDEMVTKVEAGPVTKYVAGKIECYSICTRYN